MKLEKISVDALKPLEKNVRNHGEKQIEEFAKSLEQFGQIRPFVVDEGNVVLIGNGMLEAMKRAGIEEAEVYRVKGLSETRKRKLVLTDNKIYSLGADNLDNIMDYLQGFADAGDFDIPGFDEEGIKALTQTADEILHEAMSYGTLDKPRPQPSHDAPAPSNREEVPASAEQDSEEMPDDVSGVVICPHCGEAFRP